MSKQKIVHLIAYFQPQLGYQEHFLAREMSNMGYDVHVVTSNYYAPFDDFENTLGQVLGTRKTECGDSFYGNYQVHRLRLLFESRYRVLVSGVGKTIRDIDPDYVFIHGPTNPMNIPVLRLRKKRKIRIVMDEHNLPSVADNSLLSRCYYAPWARYLRRRVERKEIAVVGVADECVRFAHEAYGIPMEQLHNVPLGADHRTFFPDREVRRITRSRLGYPDDACVVIYTGKIDRVKDPALILEAFGKGNQPSNVHFLFVGNVEQAYQEHFQECMAACRNVKVLKAVKNSELAQYYNCADIACWPTRASLSMIEAAACGLPIVASSKLAERLAYGNGIGITDASLQEIYAAIVFFAKSRERRESYGANGRRLIEERLSYERIAVRFLEIADELNV